MREILFRAKAINRDTDREYRTNYKNGDWVYGLITKPYNGEYDFPAEMRNTDGVTGIEVDYKTIGQFTGLTDKNGIKIFEGDIVLITKNTVTDVVAKIFYSEGAFRTNAANTYDGEEPLSFWLANDCDFEVIGNIYDNPELLGEDGVTNAKKGNSRERCL